MTPSNVYLTGKASPCSDKTGGKPQHSHPEPTTGNVVFGGKTDFHREQERVFGVKMWVKDAY